ncbi:killer cell lectin-like receptor subfamily G member 1 [Mantella aurantiaca]
MVALALIAIVFMSLYLRREQECECPSCPNKWTRYNHTCYFVSKKSAVWKESREYCEKHGGSLLILNQTVGQQIEELFSLQQDHWIGLEKDLGIKEWRWVNGSVHRDLVRYGDNLQLNCAYINGDIGALDCSSPRRWICMKSLWSGHVPEDLQETESV